MITLHKKIWLVAVAAMMTATVTHPIIEPLIQPLIWLDIVNIGTVASVYYYSGALTQNKMAKLALGLSTGQLVKFILWGTMWYRAFAKNDPSWFGLLTPVANIFSSAINQQDVEGRTQLMRAISKGNLQECRRLLAHKDIDIHRRDLLGRSALKYAKSHVSTGKYNSHNPCYKDAEQILQLIEQKLNLSAASCAELKPQRFKRKKKNKARKLFNYQLVS